jgi:hypothetical protein
MARSPPQNGEPTLIHYAFSDTKSKGRVSELNTSQYTELQNDGPGGFGRHGPTELAAATYATT